MIVGDILEMTIIEVYGRGVPNEERIVIRFNEAVNLGRYGIMLGVRAIAGSAFPIRDNLLWFGDAYFLPGDWLFVYTGPGKPKASDLPNTHHRLVSIHWGRDRTVLHDENIVPILFRVDAVQIPGAQRALLEEGEARTAQRGAAI